MKTLFVLRGEVSDLPPVIALINSVVMHSEVTLICSSCSNYAFESIDSNVRIIIEPAKSIKFFRMFTFRKKIWKIIDSIVNEYDLVWIASAETAIALGNKLINKRYYINSYELYDKLPYTRYRLKKFIINAEKVFVPEYNRASIMRSWWDLKELPTVVPNTPNINKNKIMSMAFDGEIKKDIDHLLSLKTNNKIILYQGVIDEERRNLDSIVKAVNELDNCVLIIMGNDKCSYIKKLSKLSNKIFHINHIQAPMHLQVTKLADIGVMTYTYGSLNSLFCAPNKIYEYTAFGIPVIGNDIPGLKYLVEMNEIGKIFDENSEISIIKAIKAVINNYEYMKCKSNEFYEKTDIDEILKRSLYHLL